MVRFECEIDNKNKINNNAVLLTQIFQTPLIVFTKDKPFFWCNECLKPGKTPGIDQIPIEVYQMCTEMTSYCSYC